MYLGLQPKGQRLLTVMPAFESFEWSSFRPNAMLGIPAGWILGGHLKSKVLLAQIRLQDEIGTQM